MKAAAARIGLVVSAVRSADWPRHPPRLGAVHIGLAVSAILIGAAITLYAKLGGEGERNYREAIALVRGIQLLSSDWSVDLTRVRSNPMSDFDSLAAFIPRMAGLKADLRSAARSAPDLPDRLAGEIAAYLSSVDAKEERIERFKTGYAVVRNSARYLSLAADNVIERSLRAGAPGLPAAVEMLAEGIEAYLAAPIAEAEAALSAAVENLRNDAAMHPAPVADALANMLDHAEVLLTRHGPTEAMYRAATSSEISDLSDRLVGYLDMELVMQQELVMRYERGVLAIVGALALFWALLAFRRQRPGERTADAPAAAAAEPSGAREAAAEPTLFYRGAPVRPAAAAAPAAEPTLFYRGAPAPPAAAADDGEAPEAAAAAGRETADEAEPETETGRETVRETTDEPMAEREVEAEHEAAAPAAPAAAPAPIAAAPPAGAAPSVEKALEYGFAVECAAGALAQYAERISAGAERLRGADTGGNTEAAAIASGVLREAGGLADMAKRLAILAQTMDGARDGSIVDIDECIDEAVAALGAETAASVVRTRGELPEAFASKTEIRLLLTKVLENALRAVEAAGDREGTIRIDTASRDEAILITVIDNGVGITQERRKNIFRPFYSSRDDAIGVGLTLAEHLAKKYDGGIRVNSLPGQGTMTRITLRASSG